MKNVAWLLLAALAVAGALLAMRARRKWRERERAEEERFAAFMAATSGAKPLKGSSPQPPAPPAVAPPVVAEPSAASQVALQKLLFEAAHKAGEAGEPALAIQLYARLLSRYPASGFAEAARAAVEALKRKLAKP